MFEWERGCLDEDWNVYIGVSEKSIRALFYGR